MKQKIAAILIALSLVFMPSFTLARGLVPCGGYKDDAGTQREPPCTVLDFFVLVATVTNWLISLAGVYAVFEIVNAGFWLVVSSGNEESITKNKNALFQAVFGFVFVMAAFILINTAVNYILLGGDKSKMIDLTKPVCYLAPNSDACKK
ncbi:MAG: hypothetical protein HY918_04320 [Candidatus Doudnabacteria bacterium]|nr:hypothetical protein [Candidatus Doudnabacteria bacterium]